MFLQTSWVYVDTVLATYLPDIGTDQHDQSA